MESPNREVVVQKQEAGKKRHQKPDTVLRQMSYGEEDIWEDKDDDLFRIFCAQLS